LPDSLGLVPTLLQSQRTLHRRCLVKLGVQSTKPVGIRLSTGSSILVVLELTGVGHDVIVIYLLSLRMMIG
jgi:hypothetical protein